MSELLKDSVQLTKLCRDTEQHAYLCHILYHSKELRLYIAMLLKGNENLMMEEDIIMHDTILSFIRTVMKKDFILKGQPMGYLKRIAKNYFLMELRKQKLTLVEHDDLQLPYFDHYTINKERQQLVQKLLSHVSDDCREILYLWAMKFKMSEIAKKMNIQSVHYTKKKKGLCLKKLIAYINSNPTLKNELKGYV